MRRLPHPILLRLLLRRGVVAWAGARLILPLVLAVSEHLAPAPVTWRPGPGTTFWFVLLLLLVLWLDLRRRREVTLISNLGIAPALAALLACLPAAAGEIALAVLLP